jgi:large subunit ribosomal protein L21
VSQIFAVIDTLGRQYKVAVGDVIKVDRISDQKKDPAEGTKVTFTEVLLVGTAEKLSVGTPVVKGAAVIGKIVEQGREKKLIAFKKKRRKGYTRKVGSRRSYTCVQIEEIKAA